MRTFAPQLAAGQPIKPCPLSFVHLCWLLFILISNPIKAQEFVWAPNFPEGGTIPLLEAPDQYGVTQTLNTLSGEKGLLLVFARSYDWCPFCKAQLKRLITVANDFKTLGINVATFTYDPVELLLIVSSDQGITFPLLHDEAIKHVKAFGILNTEYEAGSFGYGVPMPGTMLINPQGVILRKFAEPGFRIRSDFADILDAAKEL